MPRGGTKPQPERKQTDQSLRAERAKTDRALAERQAAVELDADMIVQRARDAADAVLSAARDKADDEFDAAPRATLAKERIVEDRALEGERANADESLRLEREESARILAALLPIEREKTDRFLWTERVRSDESLTHRDDFLGIVSHDLRNLLSAIVTSAAILAKTSEKDAIALAGAERIQRYAARMNRLIGDLVDVASIDAGKLSFTPVPCDAAALITEAVETFRASALEKGLVLRADAHDGVLIANFDHDRLLQVLANVISNAIKFTSKGVISVRGERAGDALRVSVQDTGCGIPAGMLESIFERFWQVGDNDRRGVGLGLYVSRCIVEAHGGKIWAESTLGKGTTLTFTLPAPTA